MLDKYGYLVYVLPLMASLVKKKKGNRLYYYLVESARVDGQPRIVHQAYLGTAEKLAELVQQKSAPVPLTISCSRPFTASVIPVRKPKSATGMTGPSSFPSGVFLLSALLRKPSGTPSNRFCRSRVRASLPRKILWIKRSCVYSSCGRRSNWSVAGCWPTIPPTSTPTLPAPTRGTSWRSAATTNKVATTCAKWA